jgi:hypothetical protein
MTSRTFLADIQSAGPKGSWTNFHTPFNTSEVFGKKGRVPVIMLAAGHTFRTSIFPEPDGTGYIQFNKVMQQETGLNAGDQVEVTLTLDPEPRELETPKDLEMLICKNPDAQIYWEKLAYSHKKVYLLWIDAAKQPETRARRIQKAVLNLAVGKNLK